MTSTRAAISGTLDRQALERLRWPIAWSGTVPRADAEEAETDLSALSREALAELDEFETQTGKTGRIKITAGLLEEIMLD